ncbi:MAG TPA: hypothetical protein VNG33_00455 [Polyangiaceae bacterium]|nr:hypothetical protein [Polyangiaceae bacterium]
MQPRTRRHALWLSLALVCGAGRASAETPGNLQVALEYRVDPTLRTCPTSQELSDSVTRQLGYQPFDDSAPQRLSVKIVRPSDRVEARIQWVDAQSGNSGERRLQSASGDCTEIAQSLSFAVAVQIQLHASEASAHAATQPADAGQTKAATPAPSQVTPGARASAVADKPRVESKRRRAVLVGVGGLSTWGMAPGMNFGGRLFGAITQDWWSVALGVHAVLPGRFQQADGTGFSAHQLGLALAPCLRFSALGACAVGSLGILRVRGEGVDRVGTPSSVVGSAGARAQLFWPELEHLGMLLEGEALVVLTPRDVLLNGARVWSTAPIVVTVALDFAAIFR